MRRVADTRRAVYGYGQFKLHKTGSEVFAERCAEQQLNASLKASFFVAVFFVPEKKLPAAKVASKRERVK